jgi:hypothetical protein
MLLCGRGFSWCAIMHKWTQLSWQIYLWLSHIIIFPYLLPTNGRSHVLQKQLQLKFWLFKITNSHGTVDIQIFGDKALSVARKLPCICQSIWSLKSLKHYLHFQDKLAHPQVNNVSLKSSLLLLLLIICTLNNCIVGENFLCVRL